MHILVAHSYFLRLDRKQLERAKPYPPLATLQVAAMLRNAGHTVQVFDAMMAEGMREYEQLLCAHSPQLVLFYEDTFNYLSKMCLDRMRQACCGMIERALKQEARVLVVGPDATDAPTPYLNAGADAVLLGEALQSILTLTQRLAANPGLPSTQLVNGESNIAILVDGHLAVVRRAKPASVRRQVERPAWDLIDLEPYRVMWQRSHGYFSLNMAASRGCSFRCNWCSKPIWGNQYLQREPHDVAAELIELQQRFHPDHIWFADDIFGFRPDWVRQFAQVVHAGGRPVPFTIQTRADLVTLPMAAALRQAGCAEAWIGAESGSQRVLDAMNKGTTIEEILIARARLKTEGIRVGFFIQLGYLGEKLDDILATRALIEHAVPDDVGVSVSYPLPGTPFHEQVKRQLGQKTRWSESSDLEMMFHGTYVSDFYRTVRDLLHERIVAERMNAPHRAEERHQAMQSLQRRWDTLIAREHLYRREPDIDIADAGVVAAG